MGRFDILFKDLAAEQRGAFMPFVTLGDPTMAESFEVVCALVEGGADALELGLPFSDPLLDGVVIQAANQRALAAGSTTAACFEVLAQIRARYPTLPISLLLCANLIEAQGRSAFYARCQAVGVDAVLVADVPVAYSTEYVAAAKAHEIAPVFICPPNADTATIAAVAKYSEGYVYLVSRAGVTSAEDQAQADNLTETIQALQAAGAAPIVQGFGIATPEQVQAAFARGCAGAIAGSATVKVLAQYLNEPQARYQALKAFVEEMRGK